jgi:hypothetical protein
MKTEMEPPIFLDNDGPVLEAIRTANQVFIDWLTPIAAMLPTDWAAAELEISEEVLKYAKVKLGIKFRHHPHPDYQKQNYRWEDADESTRFRLVAEALCRFGGRKRPVATSLGLRMHQFKVWLESPQARRFILDGRKDKGQRAAYLFGTKLVDQKAQQAAREAKHRELVLRHARWADEIDKHCTAYSYAKAAGISHAAALRRFRAVGREPNRTMIDAHQNRLKVIREILETRPTEWWAHSRTTWWAEQLYNTTTPAPHQRVAIARALRECGLVAYRRSHSHCVAWARPQDLTQEQCERIVQSGH